MKDDSMKNIDRAQLNSLQEKMVRENVPVGNAVKVTVHLGTCGIAAGGQAVLEALNQEVAAAGSTNISVVIAACMGLCSSEPNVTVWRAGEDQIIYKDLTGEKMRRIFHSHILAGDVVNDYALVRVRQTP
jgi:(2Fe-2S) ferredoxin